MTLPDSSTKLDEPAASPRGDLDVRLRHGLTVAALGLLVLVLLYVILRELTAILRPLAVAVLLCYLIVPVHRWLLRHRIPSFVSYFIIIGAVFTVIYGAGKLVLPGVTEMSRDLPSNVRKFVSWADGNVQWMKDRLAAMRPPGMGADESDESAEGDASGEASSQPTSAPVVTRPMVGPPAPPAASGGWELISPEQLINTGLSTLGTFFGFFTGSLVVVFYMIFLLAEEAGFGRRLVSAFGAQRAERITHVINTINVAVARYITVKTFVSALVGGISTLILTLFGVKYAFMWGMLTFFANFVPYVGSLFAVSFPIAMSFVQFGDEPFVPIIILILLVAAQQATGSYLEPLLLGRRLGVSPLMILLSLAFWGFLWGVPGMILSAPLVVTIKIILENIESTRPIAKLISNI